MTRHLSSVAPSLYLSTKSIAEQIVEGKRRFRPLRSGRITCVNASAELPSSTSAGKEGHGSPSLSLGEVVGAKSRPSSRCTLLSRVPAHSRVTWFSSPRVGWNVRCTERASFCQDTAEIGGLACVTLHTSAFKPSHFDDRDSPFCLKGNAVVIEGHYESIQTIGAH